MQRKFFAYYPTPESLIVQVAALGSFNSNNFLAACRDKNIVCETISEDRARRLCEGFYGFGAGCHTKRSRMALTEAQKRDGAMKSQALVARIIGGMYYGEEPLLLEPMEELVEA